MVAFQRSFEGVARNFFEGMRGEFSPGMRMVVCNLWLFERLLTFILSSKHKTATLVRTTTALTIFNAGFKSNVIPASAHATVNHRVHPNNTIQDVLDYDKKVIRIVFFYSPSLSTIIISCNQAHHLIYSFRTQMKYDAKHQTTPA